MLTDTGQFLTKTYEQQAPRSRASAELVVPMVLQATGATSVVDVGCGAGVWLAVCAEHGVTDLLGLDGEYARERLQIPAERFRATDLRQPLGLTRTFDLAMSLEVAEHLPPEVGPRFVRQLTEAAPQVLFSAAVPGQGGVGHIHERWLSYWADLFAQQGYLPVDALRQQIWNREDIAWWYRQNLMLFVKRNRLPEGYNPPTIIDVVHPALLTQAVERLDEAQNRHIGGREALSRVFSSVRRRLGW